MEIFSRELLNELDILDYGYTEDSIAASFDGYKSWVEKNHHGSLKYLEGEKLDKRQDIKKYYSEFKSAFVFLFDYSTEKRALEKFYKSSKSNGFKMGSYTLIDNGEDYHLSIRRKLQHLGEQLKALRPDLNFLYALDTQPILDRDLAYRAGLGWFGKNSMLINKKYGSFFLIGSLLCDQQFEHSIKIIDTDHCGNCTACVQACPTLAIDPETRTVEVDKCIPYFTIELFKDEYNPPSGYNEMDEIFGCDICQDVCPWNRKILASCENSEIARNGVELNQDIKTFFLEQSMDEITTELKGMSKKGYRKKFLNSSFERTGRDGILKNLKYKK